MSKFIVLEGIDGSGKTTQVEYVKRFFETEKIPYHYLHFPRMEDGIYGDLIARFLRGEFGNLEQVHPRLVSLLFAGDRKEAASSIRAWLNDGKVVFVDRYVYSNIAYQCAKLSSKEEQNELKEWILNLEFEHNQIPKPDCNLFLDVPFSFTKAKLLEERVGNDRDYLKGKEDIHEADLSFQEKVKNQFLLMDETRLKIKKISCSDKDGNMLNSNAIFDKIKKEIQALLNH